MFRIQFIYRWSLSYRHCVYVRTPTTPSNNIAYSHHIEYNQTIEKNTASSQAEEDKLVSNIFYWIRRI